MTNPSHRDGSANEPTAADRELVELRESCWRMTHELEAFRETVAVLRAGASSLAVENAALRIENEHLRASVASRRA
jgi:regulator of replication initiation timing